MWLFQRIKWDNEYEPTSVKALSICRAQGRLPLHFFSNTPVEHPHIQYENSTHHLRRKTIHLFIQFNIFTLFFKMCGLKDIVSPDCFFMEKKKSQLSWTQLWAAPPRIQSTVALFLASMSWDREVVLTSKDIYTVEQRLLTWHKENTALTGLDIPKEWISCTVVLPSPWRLLATSPWGQRGKSQWTGWIKGCIVFGEGSRGF